MKASKISLIIFCIIILFLIYSCPAPLEPGILQILEDVDAPVINITSPADYSEYATVIELRGSLADDFIGNTTVETEPLIEYSIPGTSISGNTPVNLEDGSFSADIDVSTLDGNHTITVTATDPNGNSAVKTINIVKPLLGGDISGFQVIPGNRRVTLSWSDVSGAESYSIFESSYGSTYDNVTSPFVIDNLDNGDIYTFRVTAYLPSDKGSDAVSNSLSKMPLSARTLAPWVKKTGTGSITLEWTELPNVSRYVVERSTSPSGPWEVRRNLSETEFIDDRAAPGIEYYYRVSPETYPEIKSTWINAFSARAASEKISGYNTEGYSYSVASNGNTVYIADRFNGLQIFNVSDPETPVLLAELATAGLSKAVTYENPYIYFSDDVNFYIIDVSASSSPEILGSVPITGNGGRIAVSGAYAYLANGTGNGLQIVDISEPENPSLAGNFETSTSVRGVAVYGNYAYVSTYSDIITVNITNKNNPVSASTYDAAGNAYQLDISGSYLYSASGTGGLEILTLASPGAPSSAGSFDEGIYANGVTVSGDTAFISGMSQGLFVLDVSIPASPSYSGNISTLTEARETAVEGDYIYTADGEEGLQIIKYTSPSTPQLEGNLSLSSASALAAAGDYAYVADDTYLRIIDISSLSSPQLESSLEMPGALTGIAAAGSYVYLSNGDYGLQIIDISSPQNPEIVGNFDTEGTAQSVRIAGAFAYVADGFEGLKIIDISDPAAPVLAGHFQTSNYAFSAAVNGNYAFTTNQMPFDPYGSGGFKILDVSDPQNPSQVHSRTSSGYYTAEVVYEEPYLYSVDISAGLEIFDVSEKTSPSEIGSLATAGISYDLKISGNYAYIADLQDGIKIIDISIPESPKQVGELDTAPGDDTAGAMAIVTAGSYVYVADGSTGFDIIKIWEDE